MSEKLTHKHTPEQESDEGQPTKGFMLRSNGDVVEADYDLNTGTAHFKGPNGEDLSKKFAPEAVSEKVQRGLEAIFVRNNLAKRALEGVVDIPTDNSSGDGEESGDNLGGHSFPGMFDPNYSSGLSEQEMIKRAAVHIPLTDGERLARQREADDREAAARDAYKRPEMNG